MKLGKQIIRFFLIPGITVVLIMITSTSAFAAEKWKPNKVIKMICSEKAGSSYDIESRVLAKEMSDIFGSPVAVINMPGAGHMLAALAAYKAEPDGYTLLFSGSVALVMGQEAFAGKYKWRDFKYLANTYSSAKSGTASVMTTGKPELGTWEKVMKLDRPLRWGTPGMGSSPDLIARLATRSFNIKAIYSVGYTGRELFPAAARGEVDAIGMPAWIGKPFIKSGDLNFVLAFGENRHPDYPNTPCTAELGHPECILPNQHLLLAPPGIPENILAVLEEVAYAAANSDAMRKYHVEHVESGRGWLPAPADETRKMVYKTFEILEPLIPEIKATKK